MAVCSRWHAREASMQAMHTRECVAEAHVAEGTLAVVKSIYKSIAREISLTLAHGAPRAGVEDLEDAHSRGGGSAIAAISQAQSTLLPCRHPGVATWSHSHDRNVQKVCTKHSPVSRT